MVPGNSRTSNRANAGNSTVVQYTGGSIGGGSFKEFSVPSRTDAVREKNFSPSVVSLLVARVRGFSLFAYHSTWTNWGRWC